MKKIMMLALSGCIILNSCDTYTGSGAYVGSSIGSILGSAIGGLSGGPRGSDLGTIIGMAGGAAVGAAIGSAADQKEQQRRHDDVVQHRRLQQASGSGAYQQGNGNGVYQSGRNGAYQYGQSQSASTDNVYDSTLSGYNASESGYNTTDSGVQSDSGFDASNSGDDRLYDFQSSDYTGSYSAQQPQTVVPDATVEELGKTLSYSPTLEILNARFVDDNQNNSLNRGEICKIIFEIRNNGQQPVYDVVPTVIEATGNKNIFISPSIHVECLEPGKTIRYTAMVKASPKLKDGMAKFCVSVIHEGKAISKVNEFNIPTAKK